MIRDKIITNKYVKIIFAFITYTEDGRQLFGRIFGFVSELIIILGGIKYLLKVDLEPITILLIFFLSFILFFYVGLLYRLLGFKRADRESSMKRDPVSRTLFDAARKILNGDKK